MEGIAWLVTGTCRERDLGMLAGAGERERRTARPAERVSRGQPLIGLVAMRPPCDGSPHSFWMGSVSPASPSHMLPSQANRPSVPSSARISSRVGLSMRDVSCPLSIVNYAIKAGCLVCDRRSHRDETPAGTAQRCGVAWLAARLLPSSRWVSRVRGSAVALRILPTRMSNRGCEDACGIIDAAGGDVPCTPVRIQLSTQSKGKSKGESFNVTSGCLAFACDAVACRAISFCPSVQDRAGHAPSPPSCILRAYEVPPGLGPGAARGLRSILCHFPPVAASREQRPSACVHGAEVVPVSGLQELGQDLMTAGTRPGSSSLRPEVETAHGASLWIGPSSSCSLQPVPNDLDRRKNR